MPETTLNYDTRHYCAVCDDCGTQSDYDGRIGNTDNCQHVNTTADYECSCNMWTQILLDDLFDKWASDTRYRRNEKHYFQIVNYTTGEIFKGVTEYQLKEFPGMVWIIAGTDNSEFTQRWSLSGASIIVHHKSIIRDDVYIIRSTRD